MAMKGMPAGLIDRGKGSGQSNQKTGPPPSPGGSWSAYNTTDIAGGIIYVNWSDLQPNVAGSLGAAQTQALTGTGSGWTATGINLINFAAGEAAAGHRQDGSTVAGGTPWKLIVRLGCGIYSAPYTIDNYGMKGFDYADVGGTPNGVSAPWWNSDYQASYNILIQKLAALYDDPTGHSGNDAQIACFTVSGAMNGIYQEPMLRGMGQQGNVACQAYAGYPPGGGTPGTSGTDQWALEQAMIAHQAFVFTYSDFPCNPYQYWNVGTDFHQGASAYTSVLGWPDSKPHNTPPGTPFVGTYSAGRTYNKGDATAYQVGSSLKVYVCKVNGTVGIVPTATANWWSVKPETSGDVVPFTATLMDDARGILGGKLLLGNNSLRFDGSATGVHGQYSFADVAHTSNNGYQNMYGQLYTRGVKYLNNLTPPATGSGGGSGLKIQTSTGSRLGTTGDTLGALVQYCADNGINWVEVPGGYDNTTNDTGGGPWYFLPPGTGSQGTHQPKGAADYTTLLQANGLPNTGGGGGGGGGGGTQRNGEVPASTTGPGNAQG